jgi:flagellar protein FlbT
LPLKLDIKSGEKMMINGAVLENVGPNAKILVHNQATILREKEVLTESIAATPASRVYFALQCAYMFPDKEEEYLVLLETNLADYLTACPSASEIGEEIRGHITSKSLYKGLKAVQKLIDHETHVLEAFNKGMEEIGTTVENE